MIDAWVLGMHDVTIGKSTAKHRALAHDTCDRAHRLQLGSRAKYMSRHHPQPFVPSPVESKIAKLLTTTGA